jgi:hypothetical protein
MERHYVEELAADWKIILKRFLKKQRVTVWTISGSGSGQELEVRPL